MSQLTPHRSVKIDLTSGSLTGHLLRMAGPAAAGMLLHSLYQLVDAYWLGKLGKVAVAAPGLAGPLLFIAVAFGWGLSTGGTALVAQYTGAGRHEEGDRAAGQTILLLCGIALSVALPMALLAPWILRLMQAPTDAAGPASAYLSIFMIGMPFMAFSMAYGSVLRALGDTVTVVVVGVTANVVNILLDPLLIFGWWGLPRMGVEGAALASVLSQALGALGCFVCLKRGRAGLHVTPADLVPDWPTIRRIISVAAPAAIGTSATSFGFAAFQVIINGLGTTVVSAFTICFRVLHFFTAPMFAMSSATAPLVGQALGAGKVPLARRAVRLSACILGAVMLLPLVFLMFGGQWVAGFFIDDADVIAEAGRFFRIVPASTYFFGVLMVLLSAFYGSGHTRPAMVVSILRVAVVRIPVAVLLVRFAGMGSTGAYVGMVAGNVVCAFIALWLFLKGDWESAVVPARGDEEGTAARPPRQGAPP